MTTRSVVSTAVAMENLKDAIAEAAEKFEKLSVEYDEYFDPPEALENRVVDAKKDLQSLQKQLKEMEQQDNTAALHDLRYMKLSAPYRFSQPDTKHNIIFEEESLENPNDIPMIKQATLEKLIERLTFDEYSDASGILQWLLVYRSFTSPKDFLQLLKDRFNVPEPDASVPEEKRAEFTRKIVTPVRLRVLNVVKNWTDKHWNDFAVDPALSDELQAFLASMEGSLTAQIDAIKRIIAKRQVEAQQRSADKVLSFSEAPPDPLSVEPGLEGELLAYPPLEIARQMTLIESDLYRNISSTEFGLLAWDATINEKSDKQKSIAAFITRFNYVNQWVVSAVCTCKGTHQRKETIVKLIQVADQCHALNNFNGIMEIVSGLQSSAVHRLKQTWELVPVAKRELYEFLVDLTSRADNFKTLRQAVATAEGAALPYLGVYLTDLVFIRDLSANTQSPEDGITLVNFAKMRRISSVLRLLQQLQQAPYCLQPVPALREMLLGLPLVSEEEAYQASLQEEPRGSSSKKSKKVAFFVTQSVLKDWQKVARTVAETFETHATISFADSDTVVAQVDNALEQGFKVIVAVGGEEVVHGVANAFIKLNGLKKGAVFGLIPLGGSDFARALKVPVDVYEALTILEKSYTLQIDIGRVVCAKEDDPTVPHEEFFVNVASMGIGGNIAKKMSSGGKTVGRKSAKDKSKFFLSGMKETFSYSSKPISFKLDDEEERKADLFELACCNGKFYGSGRVIAPDGNVSDGILDFLVAETTSKMGAVKLAAEMRRGTDVANDDNRKRYTGKRLVVTKLKEKDTIYVQCDGTVVGQVGKEPTEVQVVPNSFPVIVPKVFNLGRADSFGPGRMVNRNSFVAGMGNALG